VTCYSRQDVLRILQISSRQLQGWVRAGLIEHKQSYTFQDLGLLRTLRALREESVSAASIRNSIVAMKAVAGMANPLVEACLVCSGSRRVLFRHHGAIVDPISRQLFFDFERYDQMDPSRAAAAPIPLYAPGLVGPQAMQDRFLAAVQTEEGGDQLTAVAQYQEIIRLDPSYAPAYINLGTIHFHLRQFSQAEEYYRRATLVDPTYVLAFFDLGNALDELHRFDESITAYRKALDLAPRYADAHYNLALAYERKEEFRSALHHWEAYLRLDASGPWAIHARNQIHFILSRDNLSIAWRCKHAIRPRKEKAALTLVSRISTADLDFAEDGR
jgi:tetratricopeptide (TPR) repeat protein